VLECEGVRGADLAKMFEVLSTCVPYPGLQWFHAQQPQTNNSKRGYQPVKKTYLPVKRYLVYHPRNFP